MAEYQFRHAGGLGDASYLLDRRMCAQEMIANRFVRGGTRLGQGPVDPGSDDRFMHENLRPAGEANEVRAR